MDKPKKNMLNFFGIVTTYIVLSLFVPSIVHAKDFYVAPNGSDNNPGTIDQPLASLDKARLNVRSYAGREPVNVYFREGTYTFSSPVTFEPPDSGTAANPITYQGYQNENAIFSGGVALTGWREVGGRWETTIPSELPIPRQLWVNRVRATRAKTTVSGWTKVPDYGYQTPSPLGVVHPEDIEVVSIADEHSWNEERCGIQNKQGSKITMKQPCWRAAKSAIHPISIPTWLENAAEFLDQPGEWYSDPRTRKITYIPLSNQSINVSNLVIPTLEHLLVFAGTESSPVQYLNFRNFTLQYTAWNDAQGPSSDVGFAQGGANYSLQQRSPSGTIEGEYLSHFSLSELTITHAGGSGIVYKNGTKDGVISKSIFQDLSGMGIEIGRLVAKTDSDFKQTANISINNNYITKIGQEFHGAPGIYVGYIKNTRIENNTVFNIPYSGISIGHRGFTFASNNYIGSNLIVDHMQILFDGGGIYSQGPQPGTVIEKNVVLRAKHYVGGIYLDEGSQYITVQNNGLLDNPYSTLDNGGSNTFIKNYWKDPQRFNNAFQNLCTPDATNTQGRCGIDIYPTTGPNANHSINAVSGIPENLYNNAGVSCLARKVNFENQLNLSRSRPSCANTKPGDLNSANLVNQADVTLLISKYGNPYTIYDYSKIVANWNK